MSYDPYGRGETHRPLLQPFLQRGWFAGGIVLGIAGATVLAFANANYEALRTEAPAVIAAAVVMMAIFVVSLVMGVLLWAFGRRGLLSFFLGQLAGVAVGGLALRIVSA